MINIIKRGDVPLHKIECYNCKSLLEYYEYDEQEEFDPDGYFGADVRYYIVCPICNKRVVTHAHSEAGDADFRIKE